MKSFSEVLREAKQGRRPAVEVSQIDAADVVKPGARNPIKKGATKKPKPKPQQPGPEVAARTKRFSQAFGVPTGADWRTGAPTYKPLQSLTKLPGSKGGKSPSPDEYGKVNIGDLETKRQARTVTDKGGVAKATPEGVKNFIINRETKGVSRRSVPETQYRAAQDKAERISQNPTSVEYKKVESQINQEVGGRRARLNKRKGNPFTPSAQSTSSKPVTVLSSPEPGTTYITNSPGGTISGKTPEEVISKAETDAQKIKRIYNSPSAKRPDSKSKGTNIDLGDTSLPKTSKAPKEPSVEVSTAEPRKLRTPSEYRNLGAGSKEVVGLPPKTPQRVPSTYRGAGVGTKETIKTPSAPQKAPSTYRGAGVGSVERVKSTTKAKATATTAAAAAETENLNKEFKKAMRQQRKAADRLATQKFKAGGRLLGRTLGVAGAGLDIYQGYQGEKEKGSGTTRSLAKGLTQAAGAAIGAGLGGGIVPVVGTIGGATAGSAVAGKLFDVAAGENAKERARRALERRRSQSGEYFVGKDATNITQKGKSGFVSTGTGADRKTAQLASKKVITDPVTGKERVGYLAFKTDTSGQKQAVYKTGDTTQDLATTSTNPLERLGRTYAPSLYKKSDEHKKRTELGNARAQQNLMRTKLGMN